MQSSAMPQINLQLYEILKKLSQNVYSHKNKKNMKLYVEMLVSMWECANC